MSLVEIRDFGNPKRFIIPLGLKLLYHNDEIIGHTEGQVTFNKKIVGFKVIDFAQITMTKPIAHYIMNNLSKNEVKNYKPIDLK